MLTRNQMEEVIRSGGSVLHGGRLITRVEHLPTDADLAAGNPEQEALAAAALEAQIAALQAQRDRLAQAKVPQSERAPAINSEHLGALQDTAVPSGDLATAEPAAIRAEVANGGKAERDTKKQADTGKR